MKAVSLNVICRTERWNAVYDRILCICRRTGAEILAFDVSEYWKDSRCTQAFFLLRRETEEWKALFEGIFGSENNTITEDSLMHGGNPLLCKDDIFGDLCLLDPDRIYEYFSDALDHCGLFLLMLDDKDIEWHLFEEFDGDCVSFLGENTLKLLCAAGKIAAETADAALLLARKYRVLEETALWNAAAVRTSDRWREILMLSDEIKKTLPR